MIGRSGAVGEATWILMSLEHGFAGALMEALGVLSIHVCIFLV